MPRSVIGVSTGSVEYDLLCFCAHQRASLTHFFRKNLLKRALGILEHVKNLETGQIFHQVVVGTGKHKEERIWPI